MKKFIFYIIVFSVFVSCNSEKNTQTQQSKLTKTNVQQTKIITSNVFTINSMECYWEYEVLYNTSERSKNPKVTIIKKRLKSAKNENVCLDFDLNLSDSDYTLPETKLSYLDTEPNIFDVNFDGYIDFQFIDRYTSGNSLCMVYLFNPTKQCFIYSESCSGPSLENNGIVLDDERKRAVYTSKGGGGIYFTSHIYFNTAGNILYKEDFWNESYDNQKTDSIPFIFYYKSVNDSIITETIKQISSTSSLESIHKTFNHWVNTYHNK